MNATQRAHLIGPLIYNDEQWLVRNGKTLAENACTNQSN